MLAADEDDAYQETGEVEPGPMGRGVGDAGA